jgi:prefoldin subunit 5
MNDETNLRELERDLVTLKVAHATLAVTLTSLTAQVAQLERTLATLNDSMNKGKGVLWFILLIAGTMGAAITAVVKRVMEHS